MARTRQEYSQTSVQTATQTRDSEKLMVEVFCDALGRSPEVPRVVLSSPLAIFLGVVVETQALSLFAQI